MKTNTQNKYITKNIISICSLYSHQFKSAASAQQEQERK
jgi:hypothetical protein